MKKISLYIALLILSHACALADNVDSILAVIVDNNLELKAIMNDNQARSYEMKSENTINGPSLEYSPFYEKGYHGMASSELILSQEFDFPTRYADRKKQNALEGEVDAQRYDAKARSIMLEARLLLYQIVMQKQLQELISERYKQGEIMTSMLEKRLNAGDGTVLDLNKAKLEHMQASMQLTEIQNQIQDLLQQLVTLNGGKEISIDHIDYPAFLKEHEMDLSGLLAYETNLPEVSLADKELKSAEYHERIVKKSWLPNLNVGYRRNTEASALQNGILVGANFPLFSNKLNVKSARKRTEASRLRLEDAQQQASNTQKMRYDQLLRIHSILDHSDTKLLRETLDLLNKAVDHGQISALDYYTESSDIYDKLENHINLHHDFVRIFAELYYR